MTQPYDDIIDLPHHVSRRHPPMPRADRAAQFATFAALSGYEDLIAETQREKCQRRSHTQEENEALDQALARLRPLVERRPRIRLRCFVPTPGRQDGTYTVISGRLRVLDETMRTMTFTDGRRVAFDDIYAIEIES